VDLSSPELVAGRAVAVFSLERLIRARTSWLLWGAVGITAIFAFGATRSSGVGAVVVGLFALVAAAVSLTLFVVRSLVLRALRRVGGGRDYPRLRPIVERHVSEVERARGAVPVNTFGVVRLAWMARRPAELNEHIRATASVIAKTAPGVVADVRRELARPPD